MKVGQIYCNGPVRFMIMKEVIDGKRHSSIWPNIEKVEHGWDVCEVWTEGGWWFWHDPFQTWTQEEMNDALKNFSLVTQKIQLDQVFSKWPAQVIE